MKKRLWRAGKITVGVSLLVLGFIGLFLPFLQGILLLIMGLSVLSSESPRAKAWLHYLQERSGWHASHPKPNTEPGRLDDVG